jgi:hypothetical protein
MCYEPIGESAAGCLNWGASVRAVATKDRTRGRKCLARSDKSRTCPTAIVAVSRSFYRRPSRSFRRRSLKWCPRRRQLWRCSILRSNANCCVGRKVKPILSWSVASPAARTIRRTSDCTQFNVCYAAGGRQFPRLVFNASASSRHALASLSIKARCLGSTVFAAELMHSFA